MATSSEHSTDLRRRIVQAYQDGEGTQQQIAARFKVGKRTVARLWAHFQRTGSVAPLPHGGGTPPRFGKDELHVLQKIVEKRADATLGALSALFDDITKDFPSQQKYEVPPSTSVISRALSTLHLTRKKKAAQPQKETPLRFKKRSGSIRGSSLKS